MIKKVPDTWGAIQLALAYEDGWRTGYQERDPDGTDADVAQVVHRVFAQQFGSAYTKSSTDKIVGTAEQILALWKKETT